MSEVPLTATYRLQFSAGFRFADAAALAPYLADLGISHVYCSPVFAARPGSTHGYDVTDPNRFNPELGTEAEFRAMAASFRALGLGLILDVVPNHFGIGGAANAFWLSVLEWGPESPYAGWFDIDWESEVPGLAGKVLVPFLGGQYGEVLADGGLELRFERDEGSFAVWAHGAHKLPIRPEDYGGILRAAGREEVAAAFDEAAESGAGMPRWRELKARLRGVADEEVAPGLAAYAGERGEPASWGRLDALIARQHWRAAKFNFDNDAINYRRFFTISDLAGVRVEAPEVFAATHALALGLLREGAVDGLRIDHIDGLLDPKAYTLRLRRHAGRPFHLLVEKILAPDEALPADWQADGTTGYEVANLLVGLLVDPAGTEALSQTYAEFTGCHEPPEEVVHAAKRAIMDRPMAAEAEAATARLVRLASRTRRYRDLGDGALRLGLKEVVAALPVYRTYADADGLRPEDGRRIEGAIATARRRNPALDPGVFDLIGEVLTLDLAKGRPEDAGEILAAAMRLQQLSGPVIAKGLEDTALYRFNRLIALNEVGSEPGRYGLGVAEFHRENAARLARTPRGMLATSTHDTKRGEDARARIAAISGHAQLWREKVREWHELLADPERPVDRNEEYFFYQLLLGAWPVEWSGRGVPAAGLRAFAARVEAAMLKSVREAGVNTRWVFGDAEYEARLGRLIGRALDPSPDNRFLQSFCAFEPAIARDGAVNGLIQTALKLTVPGVPDIYQGAELWDQSLVDPDNRRPVDHAARAEMLRRLDGGRVPLTAPARKLGLIRALLAWRRARPALFERGDYLPLAASGPAAGSLCAFARRHGEEILVVAAALHPGSRGPDAWADARLEAPAGIRLPLRDLLTGEEVGELAPQALFRSGPVAVLVAG